MFEIKSQFVRSTDYLQAANQGCKRVVCASGGNGGLAAAYAARLLNLPATIVLPTTTPDFVAEKLRDQVHVVAIYIIHVHVLPHSHYIYIIHVHVLPHSHYIYIIHDMYYHTHSLQCACICITKSFTALGIYMYYKIIHSCKPIHVYEICTYIDIFVQISLYLLSLKKTTPDTFCSMKFVWIKLNPDCRKERST